MSMTRLSVDDLPPDQIKKLGLKVPRKHGFNKESVRSWSLHVLALMADLTQDHRRRVLEHASKVNRL
jgi:hypothetical protein